MEAAKLEAQQEEPFSHLDVPVTIVANGGAPKTTWRTTTSRRSPWPHGAAAS